MWYELPEWYGACLSVYFRPRDPLSIFSKPRASAHSHTPPATSCLARYSAVLKEVSYRNKWAKVQYAPSGGTVVVDVVNWDTGKSDLVHRTLTSSRIAFATVSRAKR